MDGHRPLALWDGAGVKFMSDNSGETPFAGRFAPPENLVLRAPDRAKGRRPLDSIPLDELETMK
jgi:hypothetical protein